MTSELIWDAGTNSEEDLGFQDTCIIMSTADFDSPPLLEDRNPCKASIMNVPRNVEQSRESQSIPGGNEGALNIQGEGSSVRHSTGGAPTAGGSAGAAGGGGGDDHRDDDEGGGAQPLVEEDESHELHGTSSSSTGSGSVPALVSPPNMIVPPQVVPWIVATPPPENRNEDRDNGNHSEGSGGISDATTARVSDTEGHGQIIIRSTNDPGTSSLKQSATCNAAMASIATGCEIEALKIAADNLDVSSAATSTLSSFTTSSSSGREDKKSISSTDVSLHLDSPKLEAMAASESTGILHDAPHQQNFEEKVAEFHISQDDMFGGPGERYTSTPSETIEILGFSQPTVSETLDDDSNLIIPPSPDAFEGVPFIYPGTPSEDPAKNTLKRSLPEEFTSNVDSISRKKTAHEVQLPVGEGSASSEFTMPDLKKMPSEKGLAAAKIGRFIMSRLDPQTSHGLTPDEDETDSPQVSESVACKIAFESQTSDSQEGSSDPASTKSGAGTTSAANVALFKPVNKEAVSESTSGDSKNGTCPSTENLILSQLMQNIANLEAPTSDAKQDDESSELVADKLYRMKPKTRPSLIYLDEKSVVKSPLDQPDLQTREKPSVDSLKENDPVLSADSSTEQQEFEEMQSDDELFLHYSPSQRMESQYFHLDDEMAAGEVAESDLDSDSSISAVTKSRAKKLGELEFVPESEPFEGTSESVRSSKTENVVTDKLEIPEADEVLKGKTLEGTSEFKTSLNIEDIRSNGTEPNSNEPTEQPTFHLPTSCAILAIENKLPEEKSDVNPELVSTASADIAGPSGLQKQTHSLLHEAQMSDECNPFESASDEFDAPVCPIGRHKRPIVWTEDSDTQECEKPNKKTKTASKSASCQVDIINESSTSLVNSPPIKSRDQAVQTVHDAASKEITKIVSEACDTTDGADIIRRTTIVTRTVIEEQLRHGKVIKKTVVETSDEPIIYEFPDDGSNETGEPVLIHPTPSKPSPESSISKSGTSSLTKSNSSLSHTSGWLGDISSSKSSSSSSLYKTTPTPSRRTDSGANTSVSKQASTPIEPKSVSGMKTLRSVKRRQFYEFKKTLNLPSPVTASPVRSPAAVPGPSTKYNSSSSSNDIHKNTAQSKPSNQRKKRGAVALSPAVAVEQALPETPVKRPGKGSKRGKPSTKMQFIASESSISPKKTVKGENSQRVSRDQAMVSRPSTSRDLTMINSVMLQESSGSLRPGARVMAKWQDKFFYPGCVLQKEKEDSWLIMYDDGDARSIKVGKILVVDVLPVGQSVYAQSADGEFDSGIILESFVEDGETVYKVEIDGGTVRNVPRSKVCLTHDQAALLEELPTNTMHGYTSICLDNIVEGKRRSRGECRESSSPAMQRSPRNPRRTQKPMHKSDSPNETQLTSSTDDVSSSSKIKHGAKSTKRPK